MEPGQVGIITGEVGAAMAVAAGAIAAYAALVARRAAASQHRLSLHVATTEWRRDLRAWASEAVDVLAEASYSCAHHDEAGRDCLEQLRGCRHRLSALVDRGRFFLPNQDAGGYGEEKPTAYRGWRHAALDPLVAAERVVSGAVGSGGFESREAALIEMRREFVSAIQRILAPASANAEIATMAREGLATRDADRTLGGLLPDPASVPPGADRLIYGPPTRPVRA